MNEALRVQGLHVSIDNEELINGIDFTVPREALVAVVGESGSGKSLMAKTLSGLLPRRAKTRGEYLLNGQPIDLSAKDRAWRGVRGEAIVWLPQDPFSSLDPLTRCGKQIMAGSRRPKMQRRAQAERLLTSVGLDSWVLNAYPHELSGGMCQRVAIAAALAPDPQVFIADEPTTALDAQTQKEVLNLLEDLRDARHMTLLLITHDLALAAERANYLMVFHHGEIVEAGASDSVIHNPQSPYTRELLQAHARLNRMDVTTSSQVVVTVQHLRKLYAGADQAAVDDVSFKVHAGEIVGLVGESGSGKTTVARCLVGLEHANEGKVTYFDAHGSPTGWSRDQAQLVFQNPNGSLNPTMTIRQTLGEALRASHKSSNDTTIRSLLNQVGLESELIDRKPQTLSGGQCQRVAIARALAPNPQLLVADEAVTALDANIQTHVLETLLDLRKNMGLGILFISHDLDTVRRISDRIIVMRRGVILETGKTSTVMNNPQHPYVRALIASMPQSIDSHDAFATSNAPQSESQTRTDNGETTGEDDEHSI